METTQTAYFSWLHQLQGGIDRFSMNFALASLFRGPRNDSRTNIVIFVCIFVGRFHQFPLSGFKHLFTQTKNKIKIVSNTSLGWLTFRSNGSPLSTPSMMVSEWQVAIPMSKSGGSNLLANEEPALLAGRIAAIAWGILDGSVHSNTNWRHHFPW